MRVPESWEGPISNTPPEDQIWHRLKSGVLVVCQGSDLPTGSILRNLWRSGLACPERTVAACAALAERRTLSLASIVPFVRGSDKTRRAEGRKPPGNVEPPVTRRYPGAYAPRLAVHVACITPSLGTNPRTRRAGAKKKSSPLLPDFAASNCIQYGLVRRLCFLTELSHAAASTHACPFRLRHRCRHRPPSACGIPSSGNAPGLRRRARPARRCVV